MQTRDDVDHSTINGPIEAAADDFNFDGVGSWVERSKHHGICRGDEGRILVAGNSKDIWISQVDTSLPRNGKEPVEPNVHRGSAVDNDQNRIEGCVFREAEDALPLLLFRCPEVRRRFGGTALTVESGEEHGRSWFDVT